MRAVPIISTADRQVVGAASVVFDSAMGSSEFWVFTSSTNCYIKQGTTASPPTASAADANTFVAAGQGVLIEGAQGDKLAVIREAADGVATLTRARLY